MTKRRWEKVSVGSLTEAEKQQLAQSLGVLPKYRFDVLNSQISDVGLAVIQADTEADARDAIEAEGTTEILAAISAAGQQTAIADPSGGGTVDTEARAAIVAILGAMRTLGLIST